MVKFNAALCSFLLIFGINVSLVAQELKPLIGEGQATYTDWVCDASSGRIFGSIKGQPRILEFSADAPGQSVRTWKTAKPSTQLILKSGRLIAGNREGVEVFDLQTNNSLGCIKTGEAPFAMFASKVDNGYVYGMLRTGSAWWDNTLIQIDIKKMLIRNKITLKHGDNTGWPATHDFCHCVMTDGGNYIIYDSRHHTSPSGAHMVSADEENFVFLTINEGIHNSFGPFNADPNGKFWSLGNQIYDLNLKTKLKSYGEENNAMSQIKVHPLLDLVSVLDFSEKKATLRFEQYVGSQSYRKTDLPNIFMGSNDNNNAIITDDPEMAFTQKGQFFLGASGGALVMQNIEKMNAPLALVSTQTMPLRFIADKERSVAITLNNPAVLAASTLKLENAPQGMKLDGKNLVWKPTSDFNEIAEFNVVVSHQGHDTTIPMSAIASVDYVPLTARYNRMIPSPNKSKLLLWQVTENSQNQASQICVVDCKTMKVLAQKEIKGCISLCAMDAQDLIYIAIKDDSQLQRARLPDLKMERKFILPGPVSRFYFNKAKLMIQCNDSLRMVDGDKIIDPKPKKGNANGNQDFRVNRDDQGNIISFHCDFVPLFNQINRDDESSGYGSSPVVWGRHFRSFSDCELFAKNAKLTTYKNVLAKYIYREYPVGLMLQKVDNRLDLMYVGIKDGQELGRVIADMDIPKQEQSNSEYNPHQILVIDGRTILLWQNKLYVIDTPPAYVKSAVAPLVVAPLPIEYISNKNTVLTLKAGKEKGVTYTLGVEVPGLSINGNKLTLDAQILSKNLAIGLRNQGVNGGRFKEWSLAARNHYQDIMGKAAPLNTTPVLFPLSVIATDEDGDSATYMTHAFFLL